MPSTINVCPHCNTMYERRVKLGDRWCCPSCSEEIAKGDIFKICPTCHSEFKRFQQAVKFEVLDIDSRPYTIKGGRCPHCATDLVYRKERSGVIAITLEDRLTADHLIQALNASIRSRTKSELHDLDEATGKERMTAYRLIKWADEKLDSYAKDVGRSVHEFLEGMILYTLNNLEWYKNNVDSFIMIWNQKARLAGQYYEYMMTRHAEYTGREIELKLKLEKLYSML